MNIKALLKVIGFWGVFGVIGCLFAFPATSTYSVIAIIILGFLVGSVFMYQDLVEEEALANKAKKKGKK